VDAGLEDRVGQPPPILLAVGVHLVDCAFELILEPKVEHRAHQGVGPMIILLHDLPQVIAVQAHHLPE
jgi:hypothetical protein